jgi:hypothetical protein
VLDHVASLLLTTGMPIAEVSDQAARIAAARVDAGQAASRLISRILRKIPLSPSETPADLH